jgi:hypothetical protein
MRPFVIGLVNGIFLALGGCVSVFEGTSQEISIGTNPSGASCVLEREGRPIATIEKTPATITVRKSKYDIAIICDKPGYQQVAYVNHSGTSPTIAANVVVDLLLTAGIASIIDSANGADNQYTAAVNLTLLPAPTAAVALPPPASGSSMLVSPPPAVASRAAESRAPRCQRLSSGGEWC